MVLLIALDLCQPYGMMEYWSAGVVDMKSSKKLSLYSSPSPRELVMNKVKEDKFTHPSSTPLLPGPDLACKACL